MSASLCRLCTALPQQAQALGRITHARPPRPPAMRALTASGESARWPPRWRLPYSGWMRRRLPCCMSGGAGLARGVPLFACAVCGRQPASEPPGCWQVLYIQLPSVAPRLCMPPSAAPAPGRAARGRPRRAPRPRRTRRTRPWRRSCARAQRPLSRRWRRRKGRPRRRARSARSPRAPCGAPAARQEHRVAPPQRHPNQSHDLLSCSRSMPCVPPSLPPRSPPTRGRRAAGGPRRGGGLRARVCGGLRAGGRGRRRAGGRGAARPGAAAHPAGAGIWP